LRCHDFKPLAYKYLELKFINQASYMVRRACLCF